MDILARWVATCAARGTRTPLHFLAFLRCLPPSTATATMASTAMVHLDQWASSQAALSDVEKASVAVLTEWLSSNQPSAARPEEGSSRASAGMPSRPTTASSIQVAGPSLPAGPLTDAPSYLAWFAKQQAHITSSTQTSHARALQRLTRAADEADVLLDHLEAARIHISELRAGARFVEEGSEGLREEAEAMVERIVSRQCSPPACLVLTFRVFFPGPSVTAGAGSLPPSVLLCHSPYQHLLSLLSLALFGHLKRLSLHTRPAGHCAGICWRPPTLSRLAAVQDAI